MMNALKRTTSYRLYVYERSFSRLQHTSAAISKPTTSDTESKDEEPKIPLVPKTRDPNAVLKALQSTVGPVKWPMMMEGRSLADPLSPYRGRVVQMAYVRMKEAGRDAARNVIKNMSKMFPRQKPSMPIRLRRLPQGRLRWLISERRVGASMKEYKSKKERGVEVSLDVLNELLALLAHEGSGNKKASQYDKQRMIVNWQPLRTGKSSKAGLKALNEIVKKAEPAQTGKDYGSQPVKDSRDANYPNEVLIWSSDNAAEGMFAAMETKDGATYDAMIQGLVKHKNYGRAFDLYTEMREQNLQASVGTYNMLLGALLDVGDSESMEQFVLLVREMSSEPGVQPNITTMNHILGLLAVVKHPNATKLALRIMREIIHLELEPTLTTLRRFLKVGMNNGEREVLYPIVDYLEQHPRILQLRSEHDLPFLFEAMFAAHKMDDAALATRLKELAEKDQYFLVTNYNYFLSLYLVTVASSGDFEQLKTECPLLFPAVMRPFEWVFGMLFKACERARDPEFALWLWRYTRKHQVSITNPATIWRFCGAISTKISKTDVARYIAAIKQVWYTVENQGMRPSELLISQTVRLYTLDDDLESAWHYFGYFKKYKYPPLFRALFSLLQAHVARGDKEKSIEIMDMMIELKCSLTIGYVRSVCNTLYITGDTRQRLLEGFKKNLTIVNEKNNLENRKDQRRAYY